MLVRESLYNFKRNQGPIQTSGVGTKTIIKNWLEEHGIFNFKINDNFTIDVRGNCRLNLKDNENELPDFIKFNIIYGSFDADKNNLISLKGFPEEVKGTLYISTNKLKTLEGCPKIIDNSLKCYNNELITLKGCTSEPSGLINFDCDYNKLESLEYGPKVVHGTYSCSRNPGNFTKEYVLSTLKNKPTLIMCK